MVLNFNFLTEGIFSALQTLSWISRSRISQAKMLGHSRFLSYQKLDFLKINKKKWKKKIYSDMSEVVNSKAGGSPIGSKIDFWGDLIFEWVAWFFVIIRKFISTPIFEIMIHEKKFLDTKKFHFRRPIFINQSKNRLNGKWSSQRPPAIVGVNLYRLISVS